MGEIYNRIAELVEAHRTTLIFVNQRRMAERAARHLAERLGEEHVTAHHGSLAKEHRLRAEQRLKAGSLRALVATSSLELGIDIGDVDLVIQIGSPRSINAFLQRVGRVGPRGRRDPEGEAVPAVAGRSRRVRGADRLRAARRARSRADHARAARCAGAADRLRGRVREWGLEELHELCRRACRFTISRSSASSACVVMLAEGYATKRGRRGALVHFDAVNRRIRGRRGAKITALSNAGTIPDQFDYDVVLSPEDLRIGTLNEDFAFESLPGDIVQLGNTSYRIRKVETRAASSSRTRRASRRRCRSGSARRRRARAELSGAVSRLRARTDALLATSDLTDCIAWLQADYGLDPVAAVQLANYLASSRTALGTLPTLDRIVFERFFDEVGRHAPRDPLAVGARINRAWGLALRKRFCRQFNFELQAAALEDSIVLSLGPTHSFPLEDVKRFLNPEDRARGARAGVLQAPMFNTRWRWAASVALAIARYPQRQARAAAFQRADAEDLLTHAFPDALACQDNLPGDRDVPNHPLVRQAMEDCLHEVMDIDGFLQLLRDIESGTVEIVCRDLTEPSPLCGSILSARPYAFLDDGAAEERRTLAVKQRALPEARERGGSRPARSTGHRARARRSSRRIRATPTSCTMRW
jgi:ATP-dependent Lhr-like helicase